MPLASIPLKIGLAYKDLLQPFMSNTSRRTKFFTTAHITYCD